MNYRTLKLHDFYDQAFRLEDVPVPSKRVGYKQENGILVAKVPIGVPQFEACVKEAFQNSHPKFIPFTGRLLMAISIGMMEKDYKVKDVDNIAKSVLDAFKGLAFEDDSNIEALYVSKRPLGFNSLWIAFKKLEDCSGGWSIPPIFQVV